MNRRLLVGGEVELADGDHIAVGPLLFLITVEPDFIYGSEENANDIDVGQHFIEGVVKAIMGNPAVWARASVITRFSHPPGLACPARTTEAGARQAGRPP